MGHRRHRGEAAKGALHAGLRDQVHHLAPPPLPWLPRPTARSLLGKLKSGSSGKSEPEPEFLGTQNVGFSLFRVTIFKTRNFKNPKEPTRNFRVTRMPTHTWTHNCSGIRSTSILTIVLVSFMYKIASL